MRKHLKNHSVGYIKVFSMADNNSGIIALVISFLGFIAFLAYLAHTRAQRNYQATTTTEYDEAGRPTKIQERVTWL